MMMSQAAVCRTGWGFALWLFFTSAQLAAVTHYFPQLACGTAGDLRFATAILATNIGVVGREVTLEFYRDDGSPWPVELRSADVTIPAGKSSKHTIPLSADRTVKIETPAQGPLEVGWAKVESERNVTISLRYRAYVMTDVGTLTVPKPLWEAGVLSSPSATLNYFPFDDTSGLVVLTGLAEKTALAVANPNLEKAQVAVECYTKDGKLHASETLTLAANGHRAMYAEELFKWKGGVPDRGHLRFRSPLAVAVLSLQEVAGAGASVFSVNSVSAGPLALTYDTEPNNDFATAQPISWPYELSGTISSPAGVGDSDYYVANLTQGAFVNIVALAHYIESPAELTLDVYGPDRQLITQGTYIKVDAGLNTDLTLSFHAKVPGPYYIVVGTTGGTFGIESVYMLFMSSNYIGL